MERGDQSNELITCGRLVVPKDTSTKCQESCNLTSIYIKSIISIVTTYRKGGSIDWVNNM